MKYWNLILYGTIFCILVSCSGPGKIDRKALVSRNNPHINGFDTLASLSVGNGNFAFTVDATGLQTFPEMYALGVPLGTQANWGWHSFPNTENYRFEETLKSFDFGHGHDELYAVQSNEAGRGTEAVNYFRSNPHRLHLGTVGLEMHTKDGRMVQAGDISDISQHLDLWNGMIESTFKADGTDVTVQTVCDPDRHMIHSRISSGLVSSSRLSVKIRFPYPTGQHTDDACNWNNPDAHSSRILHQDDHHVTFEHVLDQTKYYTRLSWNGKAKVREKDAHYFILEPSDQQIEFSVEFMPSPANNPDKAFDQVKTASAAYWQHFWNQGGAVDFSGCKDPGAKELERRVILSQYLMAIQCSGFEPPQETGLTYNSWYGKFHLEMHWWHAVHFALWNRIDLLERSMDWYSKVEPIAKEIAERQHFDGIRWMKMTDPSGEEAPSSVGSFLIWQQPHYIYMAELIYRQKPSQEVIDKYKDLVFKTAGFMASFATLDTVNDRYVLQGIIPAQETLRPAETVNPPFELSYWHYALSVAQQWRERAGLPRNEQWETVINKLSPLAAGDGLYLAAETAPQTYQDVRFTSDHMAVLGAWGILPQCRLFEAPTMQQTLNWVWDNWNWDHTWGWDYPMTAMCAARLGDREKAVGALLMDRRTNTYLKNGHNYQNQRLRIYLPGNGGLLTAVAMMCAGWDGASSVNPGFPEDWPVKWENLQVMP